MVVERRAGHSSPSGMTLVMVSTAMCWTTVEERSARGCRLCPFQLLCGVVIHMASNANAPRAGRLLVGSGAHSHNAAGPLARGSMDKRKRTQGSGSTIRR